MQDDEGRRFHARALAGGLTLSGELWVHYHDVLWRQLMAKFRALDEADISDAVTDVILGYAKRPQQYDPDKAPLGSYLRMAAGRDLLNLLEKR